MKGARAKAKANAIQGMEEIIAIASKKRHQENTKAKHEKKEKYGWYRFDTRFALPVYSENEIIRYNVFIANLVIRHDADRRKYLYDINNIKKEYELDLDS